MHDRTRYLLLGVVGTLLVLALGGWLFVQSGRYPIGADQPHLPITLKLIDSLRDHATETAAADITAPNLDDPAMIASGARQYAEDCSGCHLAPGMADSEVRAGLYPQPPRLSETGIDDDAEAFWIVKHGIKMSAMPAWGKTQSDQKIWALVAFAKTLPKLSPAQYRAQTKGVHPE